MKIPSFNFFSRHKEIHVSSNKFHFIGISGVITIILLINIVLGIYWSQEPDTFSVYQKDKAVVVGSTTTETLLHVSEILLNKEGFLKGGYLSNDVLPPSLFLDNMPAWEFGVVVQARDLVRALRKEIARSQSQSQEDGDLIKAEPEYHFDHSSWVLPSFEKALSDGMHYLQKYNKRLTDEKETNAQFYARADNLSAWLSDVETRLGSLSQRLSASVASDRENIDLAGDPSARQSTSGPKRIQVKTSWWKIDDVFYESRGSCWALLHFLKAIKVDFKEVLEKKNAMASIENIILELEATQKTVFSPMILNGSAFGLVANHSLVMANYISRANAAIIDLRALLTKG